MRVDDQRTSWVDLCRSLAATAVEPDARSTVLRAGPPSTHGAIADEMEAVARSLLLYAIADGAGAWTDESPAHGHVAMALAVAFSDGPNRWPGPEASRHAVVESASVALAMLALGEEMNRLVDTRTLDRILDWLEACAEASRHALNNWRLFALPVTAVLDQHRPNARWARAGNDAVEAAEKWYVGRGWYSDGPGRTFDYYNSFAFHFYPLVTAHLAGPRPWIERFEERLLHFAGDVAQLIDDNGAPVPFGRSLTYRTAVVAPHAVALLRGLDLPSALPLLVSTTNHFLDAGMVASDGLVHRGWTSADDSVAQSYSGPLASYWFAKSFVHLLLPPDRWPTAIVPEQRLPPAPARAVLEPPGMVVLRTGREVRVANLGSYDRTPVDVKGEPSAPGYEPLEVSSTSAPHRGGSAAGTIRLHLGRHVYVRARPLSVERTAAGLTATWMLRRMDGGWIGACLGRLRHRRPVRAALRRVEMILAPRLRLTTSAQDGLLVHDVVATRLLGRSPRLQFTGLPVPPDSSQEHPVIETLSGFLPAEMQSLGDAQAASMIPVAWTPRGVGHGCVATRGSG